MTQPVAAPRPAPNDLTGLVRAAAVAAPDHTAFVSGTARMTWAQVESAVDAAARALLGLGLAAGDRVGVHLPNTLDFPVVYFGALRAGLVVVPLNTTYTAKELASALTDSGARALVTVAADVLGAEPVPDLEHVLVAGPQLDALLAGAADGPPVEAGSSGEDLAVLLYTSGTSGAPRAAMLSHRALLANLDQVGRIEPPVVAADDIVLLVVPLFHVFGLNAALGLVLRHALTGVLVDRFDPDGTLRIVRDEQVSVLVGAPPMFVAWSRLPDVQDSFASVRLCLSGSAPLPAGVLAQLLEVTGHHVFEGYGLTETAPVLSATLLSEVARPDSIGRSVPGVELKLVGDDGVEVEEGDPGEIVVRGANLFSGYWPDGDGGPDSDGWWATGDVAYADAEGDLHLVDRRRELVLVSGFNVYPREVERVLLDHPDVVEAAVLGIPHPYTGETVKAFVVPRPGSGLTGEAVLAHATRSLARFKCPTAIELVDHLPHSATGKVSKGRLRAP